MKGIQLRCFRRMYSKSTLPLSQHDAAVAPRRNLTTLSKLLWRSKPDSAHPQIDSSSRSLHLLSTSKPSTVLFNGPSLPGFRFPSPESFNELPHRVTRHSRSLNTTASTSQARKVYTLEQPAVIFFNEPARPKSLIAARQRQMVSYSLKDTHKRLCLLAMEGFTSTEHEVHFLYYQVSRRIGPERCLDVCSNSTRASTAPIKSTHR